MRKRQTLREGLSGAAGPSPDPIDAFTETQFCEDVEAAARIDGESGGSSNLTEILLFSSVMDFWRLGYLDSTVWIADRILPTLIAPMP
jgi:hypothetical protein